MSGNTCRFCLSLPGQGSIPRSLTLFTPLFFILSLNDGQDTLVAHVPPYGAKPHENKEKKINKNRRLAKIIIVLSLSPRAIQTGQKVANTLPSGVVQKRLSKRHGLSEFERLATSREEAAKNAKSITVKLNLVDTDRSPKVQAFKIINARGESNRDTPMVLFNKSGQNTKLGDRRIYLRRSTCYQDKAGAG